MMNHKGTQTIKTDRLMLRALQSGDAPSMFQNYCSDSEVTKYLTWPAHSTIESTDRLLEMWLSEYNKKDCYRWAITLKDDIENVVGTIDVVSQDAKTDSAEIGYCIGKNFWGGGIMTEALSAVIGYLFGECEFKRVFARHDTQNAASGRVMQKNGMKLDGVLRRADRNNRGIVDTAVYSILISEYTADADKI